MARQTFAQIDALAAALPYGDLAGRVQTMCAEAAEAAATLGGEALAHLESNLCYCEDHDVCEWFAKNDVAF